MGRIGRRGRSNQPRNEQVNIISGEQLHHIRNTRNIISEIPAISYQKYHDRNEQVNIISGEQLHYIRNIISEIPEISYQKYHDRNEQVNIISGEQFHHISISIYHIMSCHRMNMGRLCGKKRTESMLGDFASISCVHQIILKLVSDLVQNCLLRIFTNTGRCDSRRRVQNI